MKAVGFKWMMNQGLEANMDKAIQKLNEQSIRVIVLERTNFLRQAISEYAMDTNNGPVHAHAGEVIPHPRRVVFLNLLLLPVPLGTPPHLPSAKDK